VDSEVANDFVDELASSPVGEGFFPEVSITAPLRNGWRAGVILSCYPEDFGIEEILVPPGRSHSVISATGGTTWLPGLRWEELLAIGDSVRPIAPASRERAKLLLYQSVRLTAEVFAKEARPVLRDCWRGSGLPIRHLDEFLDRLGEHACTLDRWKWSEAFGWTHDAEGSPRNPTSPLGPSVLPVVRVFFDSLAGSA
jgi:hypothetical protein